MKKIQNWMLAAILICGIGIFTSCSSDDESAQEQADKNRAVFIEHTRATLKDLAENLHFKSWPNMNAFLQYFNKTVLLNENYNKELSKLFNQKISESIKPVEAGSDLEAMGYQNQATIDLTNFNYQLTVDNGTTFNVEPSEELRIKMYDAEKNVNFDLLFQASGATMPLLSRTLSKNGRAVIILVPQQFKFVLSNDSDGKMRPWLTGTFNNRMNKSQERSYYDIAEDEWTIDGQTVTGHAGQVVTFTIKQDPTTHKAYNSFNFVLNGRQMIDMSLTASNVTGNKDFPTLDYSSGILDLLAVAIDGNNIDEAKLTLLDDLTTTMSISDMSKLLRLEKEYRKAGRNYADKATIEQYTQQFNELAKAEITCKGINQTIPMRLLTAKVGLDWWALYGFKFADNTDYVPLNELIDEESMQYVTNIADHSVEPMEQGVIVVRQLLQYLQNFVNGFKQQQGQQQNP